MSFALRSCRLNRLAGLTSRDENSTALLCFDAFAGEDFEAVVGAIGRRVRSIDLDLSTAKACPVGSTYRKDPPIRF